MNFDLLKKVCCAQFGQLEREVTLFQLKTLSVLLALEVKSTQSVLKLLLENSPL
jgi:hypothetical protein